MPHRFVSMLHMSHILRALNSTLPPPLHVSPATIAPAHTSMPITTGFLVMGASQSTPSTDSNGYTSTRDTDRQGNDNKNSNGQTWCTTSTGYGYWDNSS